MVALSRKLWRTYSADNSRMCEYMKPWCIQRVFISLDHFLQRRDRVFLAVFLCSVLIQQHFYLLLLPYSPWNAIISSLQSLSTLSVLIDQGTFIAWCFQDQHFSFFPNQWLRSYSGYLCIFAIILLGFIPLVSTSLWTQNPDHLSVPPAQPHHQWLQLIAFWLRLPTICFCIYLMGSKEPSQTYWTVPLNWVREALWVLLLSPIAYWQPYGQFIHQLLNPSISKIHPNFYSTARDYFPGPPKT